MSEVGVPLRVALLAGTLGRGGAEKQLVYMAQALRESGVSVRVYTLGENQFFEAVLREAGLGVIGVGRPANPLARLAKFARALHQFSPHIVQAAHFYVNLYVAIASRLSGSLGIGAIRNDTIHDLHTTGAWAPFLLRMPTALLVNSSTARHNAERLGVAPVKIHVLPNVIDPAPFRQAWERRQCARRDQVVVAVVARLERAKRVDRFLESLALARRSTPELKGVVVGVGSERESLETLAGGLGLRPAGVEFRGSCNDIPALLAEADMLSLTSDHEGFPNVILEAMAAGLPVVTTPAGDAASVVKDGFTGYVVQFDDIEAGAERMARLARSPDLRLRLGQSGQQEVTARYSCTGLSDRLLAVYHAVAQRSGDDRALAACNSPYLKYSTAHTGAERTA